jgi:hypothetical protein
MGEPGLSDDGDECHWNWPMSNVLVHNGAIIELRADVVSMVAFE